MLNLRRFVAPFFLLFATFSAHAQLTLEIIGGGANRIPIAISSFVGESVLPEGGLTAIVRADLERSGLFRVVPAETALTDASPVNFSDWKNRGADALVVGSITRTTDGRMEARFRLHDVVKQAQLGGLIYTFSPIQTRATAHRIADFIYEKLTGDRGVFSTRVAYILKQGTRFELKIADADGANPQTALASNEPIISPAWSPDGTRLAYVSMESRKPIIYIHDLVTGRRATLANFRGSNSAPAWSPDGSHLAVVLTRDGNSQIYSISPDGSNARRLSNSGGIDTEPYFSADGQFIYFTSDRGGSPQVYRMAATGGDAQRVTFDGTYNVSPRISPDSRLLTYVSRNGGRFQVMTLDLASRQTQTLTDGSSDESPSFAPNGKLILYATEAGGRGVLAAVSSDGRVKQKLSVAAGDVREPAWGPFPKQ